MKALSLYELNGLVRATLEEGMEETYWLQTELSEVNQRHGHCYLEFVQKGEKEGLIAKARGMIWANRWNMLSAYFSQTTGQPLGVGMQVLVEVSITFHELYGYSLNVVDIDPTYTVGDIARRRTEILRQLQEEGVDMMNKELEMPMLLKQIAVISSPTAAGYGDFCDQLQRNVYGLAFDVKLFPATMQGETVESSVIAALDQIAEEEENWDVVVIIRGGGGAADLSGFDTLRLAEYVAQFPLPIITGIGHERDDTVIDMVSHTRVKTPTAAAEFLIQHGADQLAAIERMATTVGNTVQGRLAQQQGRLELLSQKMDSVTRMLLHLKFNTLDKLSVCIDAADPKRILRLGFSITRVEGKAITNVNDLTPGTVIETTLAEGTVKSLTIEAQ